MLIFTCLSYVVEVPCTHLLYGLGDNHEIMFMVNMLPPHNILYGLLSFPLILDNRP